MSIERISSEDPKNDQWKLIAQFTYPPNIQRYLGTQLSANREGRLAEYIAGCMRQGEAYFKAVDHASLDISPLLLYYGAANLLAGSYAMLTVQRPQIGSHGMILRLPKTPNPRIGDTEILPVNSKAGGLQVFCNVFAPGNNLVIGAPWTLEEVLGSIPDLKKDFESCYQGAMPYTIPVEVVKRRGGSLERIVCTELSRYPESAIALAKVSGLEDAYLPPQQLPNSNYIILHRKIGSQEIGTYSVFGQKHLQISHTKKRKQLCPSQLILMFMGLFALGSLSRYHPEIWNPFVNQDESGERLLMVKFLMICQRYFPNLVLNEVHKHRIQFTSPSDGVLDLTSTLTESDLREMLKNIRQD